MKLAVGGVLTALIAVAVLIALSQSGSDTAGGDGITKVDATIDRLEDLPQDGTLLGNKDASVRVTEFGDLQCPACRQYAEVIVPELIDRYVRTGEASLAFENFTIIGPDSARAALAALAAAEQNRYWQFIDLFYANQGPEDSGYVTNTFLEEIASEAGVEDMTAWDADRRSDELASDLARSQERAARLGLDSTPTLVVSGPGGSVTLASPTLEQLGTAIEENARAR